MSERIEPVLQEHQSPNDSGSNSAPDLDQSPEENAAVKKVNKLFEKAKKHRSKYDRKWIDYYKMFRGKQWKEARPLYRHSDVVNFVFQTIQAVVPIITDSRPKFDFLPQEPSDIPLANILSQLSQADWERNNWLAELTEAVYDAHFYGTGFMSMNWDREMYDGAGGIVLQSEDPFNVFPDPDATDVNKKARFFILAKPTNVEVVKRMYPDKAKWIKPDLKEMTQGDKTDLDEVRFKSPVDSRVIIEGYSADSFQGKDQTLLIECYMFDDECTEEEKDVKDPEGNTIMDDAGMPKKEYETKLKYPQGRKICISGKVLLSDGPIPYDDRKFPVARLVNYVLPREFWGISEVEQLEGPQKTFNKIVSFALDVMVLMGNPIWIIDENSGIDTDNLYNQPGLIVEKTPGTEVRREAGTQLQPYVFQLLDRLRQWFDGISGANDVTRGVRPEGVTAASAITALQDASQTRIRQKSRNLDACLQDLGQMYVSRVLQYETVPRVVRLTNDQNATKYFKFHVEDGVDEYGHTRRVAVKRDFIEQPDGKYAQELSPTMLPITGNFDVRVTTGSQLPFAKAEKFATAERLFQAGVIDDEEFLKTADWPNWEAVLQRMNEKKAQMAQAQAQQQGAPPAA